MTAIDEEFENDCGSEKKNQVICQRRVSVSNFLVGWLNITWKKSSKLFFSDPFKNAINMKNNLLPSLIDSLLNLDITWATVRNRLSIWLKITQHSNAFIYYFF